jgi:hypothetical protein
MSRKEQPELVTSGPYAHIRHPIYTGLILAMLGSAIGVNVFWLVLLVGLPSMGRIVAHPAAAMMSRHAVNHFMGCLRGQSTRIANGNGRGRPVAKHSKAPFAPQNFQATAKSAP